MELYRKVIIKDESIMKEIPLNSRSKNRNKFVALVDDHNYDYLMQWRWNAWKSYNTYYAVRKQMNPPAFILMHRVILNTPDDMQVDHKDRNGLNNLESNIRNCNSSENQHNKIGWSMTGFKGVSLNTYKMRSIRFRAYIQVNNKFIHLGYYNTAEEAAKVYDQAALKHFGEFARTNF